MNDDLIATLDPQRRPLSAADRATAEALLEQLVTEPAPHPTFGTRRWQRALLPLAAAATGIVGIALAANLAVIPGLDALAPPPPAPSAQNMVVLDAAQTATPEEADAAREACINNVVVMGTRPEMDILVAERRGDAIFVALRQGQGTLDCIVNMDPATNEVIYTRALGPYPPTTEQARPAALASDDAVSHYTMTTPLTENRPYSNWMIHRGFHGAGVSAITAEFVGQSFPTTLLPDGTFVAWGPFDLPHSALGDGLWTYRLTLANGSTNSVIAPESAPSPAPETMPITTEVKAWVPVDDNAMVDAVVEACLADAIKIGPRPQLEVVGAVRLDDQVFVPLRNDELTLDCYADIAPGTSDIAEARGRDYHAVATSVKPTDVSGPRDVILSGMARAPERIELRGYHGADVASIVGEYGGHSFQAALFADRSFLICGPTTSNLQELGPQEADPATWNDLPLVWTLRLTFADGSTSTVVMPG